MVACIYSSCNGVHDGARREAFDALTDASAILLKHGDYHAHTDTREQMQQRLAEGSTGSHPHAQAASVQAAQSRPDADSSDDMEEVCLRCMQAYWPLPANGSIRLSHPGN